MRGFTLGIEPEGEEWLPQGKGPWEFPGERFELHDVMTEPLRLVVKTPDGSRGQAVVTPRPGATAEVELRLRGTASVQGRVVDATTGGPLSDVVVFIDNDPSSVHMRESLDQGRFSISGLDPGEYVLNILGRHTSGRLRLPCDWPRGKCSTWGTCHWVGHRVGRGVRHRLRLGECLDGRPNLSEFPTSRSTEDMVGGHVPAQPHAPEPETPARCGPLLHPSRWGSEAVDRLRGGEWRVQDGHPPGHRARGEWVLAGQ
ncbi:carboxypeptidase-like regulatory domain-containing protein [Cystobacter fuscus]